MKHIFLLPVIVFLQSVLTSACSNATGQEEQRKYEGSTLSGRGVPLTKTEGGGAIYPSGIGLCKTALRLGGPAGLYRVERMTSQMEVKRSGNSQPFTYVELALLEGWSEGAPKEPVARIRGGVFPDGNAGCFEVSLNVGEIVGLILQKPTEENLGYYGIDELGVFHKRKDERYTNGYHFITNRKTLSELGKIIISVIENRANGCTEPDIYEDPESEPVRRDALPDQIYHGEVLLEKGPEN